MPSLRCSCLKVLPVLVRDHVRRMSHKAAALASWFGIFEGNVAVDREEVLTRQIGLSKRHIYESVVWYDHEDVFRAMLQGVEEAVAQVRKNG